MLPFWSVTVPVPPAAGLTVIVKLIDGPVQTNPPLVKVGVTVIVPTMGVVVVLLGVKDGIFPLPDEAKPKLGVSLIQV